MDQYNYHGPWDVQLFPQWWPLSFQQQMVNFLNVCLDPTLAGFYPELDASDANSVNTWLASSWLQCLTKDHSDDPHYMNAQMTCPDGWDCTAWSSEVWWTSRIITRWEWNIYVMSCYVATLMRLDALWPGHADDIWIYFYYPYDTLYGRILVDQFIYDNPGAPADLIDALTHNHVDYIQRMYGILNMPDLNGAKLYYDTFGMSCNVPFQPGYGVTTFSSGFCAGGGNATGWHQNLNGGKGGYITPDTDYWNFWPLMNKMHNIAETSAFNRLGNPVWTPKQRMEAYNKLLSPRMVQESEFKDRYLKGYWDFYLANGWFQPGKTPTDPPTVTPPPNETRGLPNPTHDPAYKGDLPNAPKPVLPDQRLWHPDEHNPNAPAQCVQRKGTLEKVLPIAAGVIGGVLGSMLMPGPGSRLSGGLTLGGFGYFYMSNTYGWSAFMDENLRQSGKISAQILSGGIGVTLALAAYDLGIVPVAIDYGRPIDTAAAGAASYVVLEPILSPILTAAGNLATFLTLPIAFLERFIDAVDQGCVKSYLHGDCLCEDAAMKSKLAVDILRDIYGVTDEQLTLRTKCMRNQMMQGMWGADPEEIGVCDPVYKTMDNPAACLDAAVWTSYNIPPGEDLTLGMFALISPCLDPGNAVFMPPRPEDTPCTAKGPHFRMIDGVCTDYGVDTIKI